MLTVKYPWIKSYEKKFLGTLSTVQLCKAKWNILRGGYRRVLRNKETSFGGRKWRFEDDMSFLKDCVMERRRHTTRGTEDPEGAALDNEEEFITIVKEEPMENLYDGSSDNIPDEEWVSTGVAGEAEQTGDGFKVANQGVSGVERVREVVKEVDCVTQFFLSMAETVKSLPLIMQARVKGEVFKAVNAAEVQYLQEKGCCRCKGDKNIDHTYS